MRRMRILMGCLVAAGWFVPAGAAEPQLGRIPVTHGGPIGWNSSQDAEFDAWHRYDTAGWTALGQQYFDTAEHEFTAAIKIGRTDPVLVTRRLMARSYAGLAVALHRQGRHADALPLSRWALAVREVEVGPDSPQVASSLTITAMIERELGHPAPAESMLRRALAIYDAMEPTDPAEVSGLLMALGEILVKQRRYAEVEGLVSSAVAIRDAQLGLDHPDTLAGLNLLSQAQLAQDKEIEALPVLRRVVAGLEARPGSRKTSDLPAARLRIAEIEGHQGRWAEADDAYRRAIAELDATVGPAAPATTRARQQQAASLEQRAQRRVTIPAVSAPILSARP